MKTLFKIIIIIPFFVLFSSCEKSLTDSKDSVNYSQETADLRSIGSNFFDRNGITFLKGDVSITCGDNTCQGDNKGFRDFCQVGGSFPPDGKFECTCAGCTMVVVFNEFQSSIDIWSQIYSEDLHFDKLSDLTYELHDESILAFNSIDFNFQPLYTTILYTYTLANGSEETIMFVNTYTEAGLASKTYTINCTGTCGCREKFNLNTSTASCSCDDCTLTVKVEEASEIETGGN